MSKRYPGGIITKSPATPTGPFENGTAPGVWTLDQQLQYQQQGIWPTAGLTPNYIEDVFSTYVYTGTGNTNTIINGIDLSGKGGLVWTKSRSNAYDNWLFDTARGAEKVLISNTTAAQGTTSGALEQFNSNGYRLGYSGGGYAELNEATRTYVSWTFREQAKFFDIVTWTGDDTNRTITHNLGSAPGCLIIKATTATDNWYVWHRSLANGADGYLSLNLTAAEGISSALNGYTPTASNFQVYAVGGLNTSGTTYVAYLFAHNAGGFGLTGTDNVISCGSYVSNGSRISVTLGWEPQWILIKKATGASNNWTIVDSMRELTANATNASAPLFPNLSNAETASSSTDGPAANATGFSVPYSSSAFNYPSGETYIYIAIRRGPMKTPTVGTSVLAAVTRSGNSTQTIVTGASSPPDLVIVKSRSNATEFAFTDRLRGVTKELSSSYNFSEADFGANPTVSINMNGWTAPAGYGTFNQSGYTYVDYLFSRWPNVFDEVCYTGTGAIRTISHNLTVAPEWIIVKKRSASASWYVYVASLGASKEMILNLTLAEQSDGADLWNSTNPTSSVFTLGADATVNQSSATYVAYLFATLAGVSKVGSYTGTGASQVINCGFTTGARWVLIKRTDSTGDWYVWDTARGMVSGTDPYMIMNDALAETNANYVFTSSTGFTIQSGVPAAINANGGTYIFLAIA